MPPLNSIWTARSLAGKSVRISQRRKRANAESLFS
jgi:hypothetical protein